MISYTTSINLNDTISLSKECDEIHSKIEEQFNGITKNNKLILQWFVINSNKWLIISKISVKTFG